MVRPSGRRGDDDLGLVTDRTGRVEGRTVTASTRGVRGRHSTSNLSITPTPFAHGFHHGIGEAGYSTQPLAVPFRSRPPLQPHLSHTPVPYEPYRSAHPPSHPTDTIYDPYLHAPTTIGFLRVIGLLARNKKESDPYIFRERRRREVMMMVMVVMMIRMRVMMMERSSPICCTCSTSSGLDRRPRHGKGKGLRSRNKRPEVAHDVPAPIQKRKKVNASDWEQTGAVERDRGLLKCRSRYMALTGWDLTDSQAQPLASGSGVDILVFSHVCTPFRHSSEECKPYIQMFLTIGYKNENKLLDIRLRLDMMTTDEVQWIPYRTQDIRVGYPHGTESWTSVPAIPASSCTDDCIGWYLSRTHPRIQNPENIPSGYNVLVAPTMPLKALLDLIACEFFIDRILMVMSLDVRFEIY
ncbi:hypothetical protein M9H77_16015 [Catharanthus roseus]|uniref:Uncharacterized protein n=1 Tax=Catharanthus roseus TaxID=4058 RepID=A0ACC0AYQ1_CATRO|nr:hypothetical protein M9H77_16015 [Catharanthus roseus]